jgi:hypothetical protein
MPFEEIPGTLYERLIRVARQVDPDLTEAAITRLREVPAARPSELRTTLTEVLSNAADEVIVTGTIERRLLAVQRRNDVWTLADLAGRPHASRDWPRWARDGVRLVHPDRWLSSATLDPAARLGLLRPSILLVALYHPEYFPLPRFPLGISDLARAARAVLVGRVELLDMQLGATTAGIIDRIETLRPDIFGISATFGQHDLLTELLDRLAESPTRPLCVAGGSLTVRNERLLAHRYPWLLIARGSGEVTVQDTIEYWRGARALEDVRGIGYAGSVHGRSLLQVDRLRHTAGVPNRARADIYPELDLLDLTFEHHGVAQLESSRGCTNYCSFCPRGHKGSWAGPAPADLKPILAAMDEVFRRHEKVSRTIFLVDEEFIGGDTDAVERAVGVADALHDARFGWETSCRVDQVVRSDRGRDWHLNRAELWRYLVDHGLRRCLFGIESGVNSVLERFNKETSAEQNVLAIRTLSALGVPTRYTYITFDQMMTESELHETYSFQVREDLILRPLPSLSLAEIVDGVRDSDFVAEHSTGRRFYTGISYLLVSMECLIGAAYTRAAHAAGLTGATEPLMGRVEARFADWRIGRCSLHAQLWVDRHFALDYTLKSLEKILDGAQRRAVREARVVIKDAAIRVLGGMVRLVEATAADGTARVSLDLAVSTLLENEVARLAERLAATVADLARVLPAETVRLLEMEFERWRAQDGWALINASDRCDGS